MRNWSLHDDRLNLTLHYMHSGALYLRDHMGLQTLTHPAFARELDRLGLLKTAPTNRRPDIAVFGTSFHDDMQLGGPCGRASRKECECAAQPMGDPASKSFPHNLTWSQRVERYRYHAAQAVRLLTGVQAAGTRVAYLSLFPRSSGVEEYLRAAADDVLFAQLKTAGFFAAGGLYMDQWPIYASYFDLGRAHRAEWGLSTLHYAQLSNRGHMMTNDLILARLTLLLNSWCTPAAEASSPCGVGSHCLPLAAYVRSLNASCSCGSVGMTRQAPQLCWSTDAARTQATGRELYPVRAHPPPPYSKWRNAPAVNAGAQVNQLSPSQRADAILTGAVLNPEWPGLEEMHAAHRPWFVPEGGFSPKPWLAEAVAQGYRPAASCPV
jgi:hypothetical protein